MTNMTVINNAGRLKNIYTEKYSMACSSLYFKKNGHLVSTTVVCKNEAGGNRHNSQIGFQRNPINDFIHIFFPKKTIL